jgi:hydrogenase expression/formation protein HypC
MCQILPSRVVAVRGSSVQVELADGQRTTADASLVSEIAAGDYVLIDRGLVIERLSEQEARTIIGIYQQIGDLLDAEDALP